MGASYPTRLLDGGPEQALQTTMSGTLATMATGAGSDADLLDGLHSTSLHGTALTAHRTFLTA